jgi:hypothetical protein
MLCIERLQAQVRELISQKIDFHTMLRTKGCLGVTLTFDISIQPGPCLLFRGAGLIAVPCGTPNPSAPLLIGGANFLFAHKALALLVYVIDNPRPGTSTMAAPKVISFVHSRPIMG